MTVLYIAFLFPIRILFVWTVRGYYRELRYILHNREIQNADTEDKKLPKLCDNCHTNGEPDLEAGDKPKDNDVQSVNSRGSKNSKGSKRRFKFNSCHGCGNELKPWEGQKPFDDISQGSRSQRSKNSKRSKKSHLSSNQRRRESDVGDTP